MNIFGLLLKVIDPPVQGGEDAPREPDQAAGTVFGKLMSALMGEKSQAPTAAPESPMPPRTETTEQAPDTPESAPRSSLVPQTSMNKETFGKRAAKPVPPAATGSVSTEIPPRGVAESAAVDQPAPVSPLPVIKPVGIRSVEIHDRDASKTLGAQPDQLPEQVQPTDEVDVPEPQARHQLDWKPVSPKAEPTTEQTSEKTVTRLPLAKEPDRPVMQRAAPVDDPVMEPTPRATVPPPAPPLAPVNSEVSTGAEETAPPRLQDVGQMKDTVGVVVKDAPLPSPVETETEPKDSVPIPTRRMPERGEQAITPTNPDASPAAPNLDAGESVTHKVVTEPPTDAPPVMEREVPRGPGRPETPAEPMPVRDGPVPQVAVTGPDGPVPEMGVPVSAGVPTETEPTPERTTRARVVETSEPELPVRGSRPDRTQSHEPDRRPVPLTPAPGHERLVERRSGAVASEPAGEVSAEFDDVPTLRKPVARDPVPVDTARPEVPARGRVTDHQSAPLMTALRDVDRGRPLGELQRSASTPSGERRPVATPAVNPGDRRVDVRITEPPVGEPSEPVQQVAPAKPRSPDIEVVKVDGDPPVQRRSPARPVNADRLTPDRAAPEPNVSPAAPSDPAPMTEPSNVRPESAPVQRMTTPVRSLAGPEAIAHTAEPAAVRSVEQGAPAAQTRTAHVAVTAPDGQVARIQVTVVGDQVMTRVLHPDPVVARVLAGRSDELRAALSTHGLDSTMSVTTAAQAGAVQGSDERAPMEQERSQDQRDADRRDSDQSSDRRNRDSRSQQHARRQWRALERWLDV